MRLSALSAVLLAATSWAADVATPTPLQPADVFALQWAAHPQISPDGKRIVYERSFYDNMKDVKRANLWLLDVDSGRERPLTTGSTRESQVAWAPDGKRIAYVGADGDKAQIFVRWVDSGEIARVTQLADGPGNLAWSPDGRWIAFTLHEPQRAKLLADLPPAPEGAQWAAPAKVIDRLVYRQDGGGYLDDGFTHVYVVAANGGTPRRITSGAHNFDGVPAWSADGKSLFISTNLDADWEYQATESEIYRVGLDDGVLTRLTNRKGPDYAPQLSADGKHLAYLGHDDKKLGYQNDQLYVLDLASGKSHSVTDGQDIGVEEPAWDGSRGLFFHYDDRGTTKIGWVGVDGGAIRTVAADVGVTDLGRPYGSGAFSAAAGRVAYTRGDVYRPAEVGLTSRDGKARSLTALNDNLLEHRQLGRVEEINFASSADQRQIQGWLMYPPDFDQTRKYPLLLEIHGGPNANYGPRFAPETQLYAAHGYVVLYINPRGSTSYGEDFANLIQNDYPNKDYDDLISGVDKVIERGYVDTDNLFVTGGSGGGVLTAWIVGHTDRFRAAVVAKPVINWLSFVLTSDATNFYTEYWFPAAPWENTENYAKRSPISYVGKVKTPTMLIVGESDYRTPISEAEQFYVALKLRRVETVLVRLPGASHGINSRPSQMLTQVLSTIAWFDQHKK